MGKVKLIVIDGSMVRSGNCQLFKHVTAALAAAILSCITDYGVERGRLGSVDCFVIVGYSRLDVQRDDVLSTDGLCAKRQEVIRVLRELVDRVASWYFEALSREDGRLDKLAAKSAPHFIEYVYPYIISSDDERLAGLVDDACRRMIRVISARGLRRDLWTTRCTNEARRVLADPLTSLMQRDDDMWSAICGDFLNWFKPVMENACSLVVDGSHIGIVVLLTHDYIFSTHFAVIAENWRMRPWCVEGSIMRSVYDDCSMGYAELAEEIFHILAS